MKGLLGMEIKIFIPVIFVFVLSNVYAIQLAQPTDRDLDGLVGLVKRVEEEVAEMKMKGGKLTEGSQRPYCLVTYDRQGRMTRRWMNVTGSSSTDQSFSYDKEGARHARYKIFNPLVKSTAEALHVFHFDADENALHEDVYVGDKPARAARTQRYMYRFGTGGRLAEKIFYTTQGDVAVRDVYTYGADRHPTERRLYGFGNPTPQTIKYTYTLDSQGNWIKRVEENTQANQERTQRITITYRKISYY
jgi:hypothetical protein